jgi:hypothetical protein
MDKVPKSFLGILLTEDMQAAAAAQSTANTCTTNKLDKSAIKYGVSQPSMNVGDIWLKPVS